jgi:hypothetical protein
LTLHCLPVVSRLMARPLRLEFPVLSTTSSPPAAMHTNPSSWMTAIGISSSVYSVARGSNSTGAAPCTVWMENHDHLVIETPEPNLSRGLRRLHSTYTQGFNRGHQRVGHLLQGRFKSLLVEKEGYLQELCRYVVLNPVRAGMVAEAGGWAWSSYRAIAGIQAAPGWLDVAAALSLFDRTMATARTAYRRFVAEGIHQPSPW